MSNVDDRNNVVLIEISLGTCIGGTVYCLANSSIWVWWFSKSSYFQMLNVFLLFFSFPKSLIRKNLFFFESVYPLENFRYYYIGSKYESFVTRKWWIFYRGSREYLRRQLLLGRKNFLIYVTVFYLYLSEWYHLTLFKLALNVFQTIHSVESLILSQFDGWSKNWVAKKLKRLVQWYRCSSTDAP